MNGATYGRPFRLDALLSNAAAIDPARTALICGDLSLTYAEVHDRARRFAGAVATLGVRKGDRVAMWAPNRPEFLEVMFAIPLLGAIGVPLDHWANAKDVLTMLAQIRPKVLVVGGAQAEQLAEFGGELSSVGVECILSLDPTAARGFHPYSEVIAAAVPLSEPEPASDDDPALMLFTSGSTGRPKGAVHTHRSVCAAAQIMSLELGLCDGERTLHFLPLYSSCFEHLIPLTLMRATHVIMPHFDAALAWEAVAAHRVTHIDAVPTTLRRMLEHAPDTIPDSLRVISFASEPMPTQLITALVDRFPSIKFVQFYGMIEQLCLTVQGPAQQLTKPGTVGRPMMGAELRILAPDGKFSDGRKPGEIVARTPTMFAEYWQAPQATSQVLQDGWMRTGDIGHFDGDGFLVLSGRIKQVIKSGGVTVIPETVERVLLSHKRVHEAVVVGIPDENWGEAVHAFVVLNQGPELDARDLIAFCRSKLTGYQTPKCVHFVRDFPRTGIGKVARREVRDQFLRSQHAEVTG